MAKTLKEKTVGALFWNAIDRVGQQVILFIIGIKIARILSPDDYALVGMLAIFMALANIVIESGFSAALIRKKDATEKDYSSVFYFNLGASILAYLVLFVCAPYIAEFYNQPSLTLIARIVFLALPINSLSLIQTTILTKQINFKKLTKVNFISLIVSSLLALYMAYAGYGVWTLVMQPVSLAVVRTILLWIMSSWRPVREFSLLSIKDLFAFASNLMLSSIINTGFQNAYSVFIGKIYPLQQLGYYSQANKMCDMGVSTIYGSIQNATFPIFSSIQDEKERLLRAYRKTIRLTSFLTFPAMTGLILVSEPFIRVALTDKWAFSVPFLQLLCLGGIFNILATINGNFLKVNGRSDIILKLDISKIAITAIALFCTLHQSVLVMVAGLVVTRIVVYLANIVMVHKYCNYSMQSQLKDIMPYLLISSALYACFYPLGLFISDLKLLLFVQIALYATAYIFINKWLGSKIFDEIMSLFFKKGARDGK
ncbi:lipopolysaccharide biosynthesis protein [Bacteroides sedimenti]|uniref:Lipopolysaccharide biosynthesis protein n=1 Tax=Bacteroides sedimenti TaxID=2136147 RepID=A0ABN6Z6P0_9BACE